MRPATATLAAKAESGPPLLQRSASDDGRPLTRLHNLSERDSFQARELRSPRPSIDASLQDSSQARELRSLDPVYVSQPTRTVTP